MIDDAHLRFSVWGERKRKRSLSRGGFIAFSGGRIDAFFYGFRRLGLRCCYWCSTGGSRSFLLGDILVWLIFGGCGLLLHGMDSRLNPNGHPSR